MTRRPPGRAEALLADEGLEVLVWPDDRVMPHQQLLEAVSQADGLYCMLSDRIDQQLVAQSPRLRVISQMAVGVDNLDLAACATRNIRIGHTPDVLTETTADLGMALLLAAGRRIAEGRDEVLTGGWGDWDPAHSLGRDIHSARLGIVGMGRIGCAVARRAAGFNMDVVYHNRTAHPDATALGARLVDFDELLITSDFIILTCPLTTETHHLIDRQALRKMRPEAILVNVARGPVIDTAELAEALTSGEIRAAALDVTDPEPLPSGHDLLRLANCLVVPHIGSATVQARAAMAELAAENLIAGLAGRPMPAEYPLPGGLTP